MSATQSSADDPHTAVLLSDLAVCEALARWCEKPTASMRLRLQVEMGDLMEALVETEGEEGLSRNPTMAGIYVATELVELAEQRKPPTDATTKAGEALAAATDLANRLWETANKPDALDRRLELAATLDEIQRQTGIVDQLIPPAALRNDAICRAMAWHNAVFDFVQRLLDENPE